MTSLTRPRNVLGLSRARELGFPSFRAAEVALTRRRVAELKLSIQEVASVAESGVTAMSLENVEGRYLLAGAADGALACYDLRHSEAALCAGRRPGTVSHAVHEAVFQLQRAPTSVHAGHSFGITAMQWYPVDTGMFITASYDTTVKAWDANTLQVECVFHLPSAVLDIALSPLAAQHSLVATAADSQIRLCDLVSSGFTHTLSGHRDAVRCVAWSAESEWVLISGGCDGGVRLWDIRRAGALMVLDQFNAHPPRVDPAAGALGASALHPPAGPFNKRPRLAYNLNSTHGVWSGSSYRNVGGRMGSGVSGLSSGGTCGGSESRVQAHSGAVNALLPLPGGLYLLSAGRDGALHCWDLASGKNTLLNYAGTHATGEKGGTLACSSDGFHFYFPCGNTVKTYETITGKQKSLLKGHFANINCCEFNRFTDSLITGANDRQILIWEPSVLDSSHHDPSQQSGSSDPLEVERISQDDEDAWSDG